MHKTVGAGCSSNLVLRACINRNVTVRVFVDYYLYSSSMIRIWKGRFVIFLTRLAIYSGVLQKHTQNSLKHNLNNQWALYFGFGNWEQSQLGWNFNKCFAAAFTVYFKQGTRLTVSEIKIFLSTEQIMCNTRNFPSAQSPALESFPTKDEKIF